MPPTTMPGFSPIRRASCWASSLASRFSSVERCGLMISATGRSKRGKALTGAMAGHGTRRDRMGPAAYACAPHMRRSAAARLHRQHLVHDCRGAHDHLRHRHLARLILAHDLLRLVLLRHAVFLGGKSYTPNRTTSLG